MNSTAIRHTAAVSNPAFSFFHSYSLFIPAEGLFLSIPYFSLISDGRIFLYKHQKGGLS